MLLGISDKTTDISHKSIVLIVSINRHHVVKTLLLDFPETQEGHVLASVPSLAVVEEWFLSWGRRVVFSIVFPVEQVSDRPVLAIVAEGPLSIA